jgi:hypothetical protein
MIVQSRHECQKTISGKLKLSPDDQSWGQSRSTPELTESILQLIGEGTRCMPPCNSLAASVLGKLQDRPLSIRPCRLHNNVLGIINGDNNSGCQLQLIPGLANINDENTIRATLPDIAPSGSRNSSCRDAQQQPTSFAHRPPSARAPS